MINNTRGGQSTRAGTTEQQLGVGGGVVVMVVVVVVVVMTPVQLLFKSAKLLPFIECKIGLIDQGNRNFSLHNFVDVQPAKKVV